MSKSARRYFIVAEVTLLAVAAVCGIYCAWTVVLARSARQEALTLIQQTESRRAESEASAPRQDEGSKPPTVIGNLAIPDLKLEVPILSDFESTSLKRGVGHLAGTALPGGLGMMALAGHRDTYFKPLPNIRRDMDIQVTGRSGVYHYSVDSTEVIRPEDVQILDIGTRPELVLITCYPFNYIGAAPQRFIVHAHLLSALPDDH
jgi:sortase A